MHSHPILRSHVFSKFLVLLILSTFFSATTTTQTISAAEGEKCPLTNEDGIVQHIEQMVKEETESSKVAKDLFTGAHQGWHAKMPHLINALLEKLLWSWTSNPKKTADLKEQFNTMVKEILAKIGLYGAEEMPVKNATAHILEEIKTKYLVPMAGKINPDWAKKVSQLGNRSVPPPAQGHQQMEGEETNPNEPQNATEGEQKEEEPGAGFQTELLNHAYGSLEGLLADIKSGEVDKETKRECAKPWKERLAFVNSIAGKQLGALKAKVLAMMKAFWVRTKYGGLVMAFANLPAFLREKNSSTWGWVAKCVGKVRGGGVESVREKANKHLAESEQNHTAPAAAVLSGSAGQSSAVDFLHRAKRARPSPGSRSSHTTYFIFVSGHNPPVFGHQFKYGTSLAIGFAYYTGWFVYVGFVGFVSVALWVDSEDSVCERTSAWLFSIFSILSSIFLLFLPLLDIY